MTLDLSERREHGRKKGKVVADKASRRGVRCCMQTCHLLGSVKKGQAARSITLNPDDAICNYFRCIHIDTHYIYICDI